MNPDIDITPEATASIWWNILDDALRDRAVVSVRLISGDLYTGKVSAVDFTMVTLAAPDPTSREAHEHTIALAAIIAITSKPREEE